MQFTKIAITAILAFTSSTLAVPLEARQDENQPWQLNSLSVFTPSGRPLSYPWATITANITDPNQHVLGTSDADGSEVVAPGGNQGLNCQAKWYTRGDSPLGRAWPCDGTEDGHWVMYIENGDEGKFSSTNFVARFRRNVQALYLGQSFDKSFEGSAAMKVGDNMSGSCGGSGVCGWSLKAENKPFPVENNEVN